MSLTNKPFDQLIEADFLELIENKVPEGKTLDYKVDLKFGDRDKREFLADIASFANTAGGHLLIGIKEEGGIPTALPGVELDNPDAEKLKLISLIRDCTEPRIPGVTVNSVPLQCSRYIIAIHIPKSWAAPHVVSIEKHWRFYARHSSGKYQLDVPELRQAFLMSESLAEKIRRFHTERVGMVISKETPVNLVNGPKFIVHIVPVDAFGSGQQVDVSMLREKEIHFIPLGGVSEYSRRFNLDGYLTFEEDSIGDKFNTLAYTQLFRNGIVESVCVDKYEDNSDNEIPIVYFENQLIEFVSLSLQSLKKLGVEFPYSLMVTITGVKGFRLDLGKGRSYSNNSKRFIDRDVLQLPDVLIEDDDSTPGKIMRPIFDAIWNAAGWEKCPSYDVDGRWKG